MAAAAMLCGCQKENLIPQETTEGQNQVQALTFTATVEGTPETRATFNDTNKCAAWEEGDQININGKIYSAQTAGTTTTFKADDGAATGDTYNAYFPASLFDGTTTALPAIQTYSAGKFNIPMYAESNGTNLEFKNICTVLAVKVTSADIATLKSIKVASDKAMYGAFSISGNKAVLTDASDKDKTVELVSEDALTLDAAGTTFYIAIPAQGYAYLRIYISADGTDYNEVMATKKAAGLGILPRNTIFPLDYAKNAVQLWASGPFFATMNVGATTPEGLGGYYAWGETKAYGEEDTSNTHNYQTMRTYTKTYYHWNTYKYNNGTEAKDISKYTIPDNKYAPVSKTDGSWYKDGTFVGDNKSVLDPEDDAAYVNWGASWSIPSQAELEALKTKCTWTYKSKLSNPASGFEVTGTNGNTIFLPMPGYHLKDKPYEADGSGNYWCNSLIPTSSISVDYIYFNSGKIEMRTNSRFYGYSVRAVCR